MTIIYAWNVLSFGNIYKMSDRVVISQMLASSSCFTFECDSVSCYLHAELIIMSSHEKARIRSLFPTR